MLVLGHAWEPKLSGSNSASKPKFSSCQSEVQTRELELVSSGAGATRPKLAPEQNQCLHGVCCVLCQQIVLALLAAGYDGEGSGRPPAPTPQPPRLDVVATGLAAADADGGKQLRRSTRTRRAATTTPGGGRGLGAVLVGDAGALGRRSRGACGCRTYRSGWSMHAQPCTGLLSQVGRACIMSDTTRAQAYSARLGRLA